MEILFENSKLNERKTRNFFKANINIASINLHDIEISDGFKCYYMRLFSIWMGRWQQDIRVNELKRMQELENFKWIPLESLNKKKIEHLGGSKLDCKEFYDKLNRESRYFRKFLWVLTFNKKRIWNFYFYNTKHKGMCYLFSC